MWNRQSAACSHLSLLLTATVQAITTSNMASELFFGTLPLDGTQSGMVKAFNFLMSTSFIPQLNASDDWGKMLPGDKSKSHLIHSLDATSASLLAAAVAIDSMVRLKVPSDMVEALAALSGPQDYARAADQPANLEKFERMVAVWCDQVEEVLAISQTIRSESDNVGPHAELDHWKQRTATFNGLLEQMSSKQTLHAIGVLTAGKARSLERWRAVDIHVTEQSNESRDNVRYLKTLSELAQPLYDSDIGAMKDGLPALISAVAMIHSVSRFYNTQVRAVLCSACILVRLSLKARNLTHLCTLVLSCCWHCCSH